MHSKLYNTLRLGAALLTLLAVLGHHYMPAKRSLLYPHDRHTFDLYADEMWGGNSSAQWLNAQQLHWRCTLAPSDFYPVCGMSIGFPEEPGTTRDLSRYESLNLQLEYSGEAVNLRVYLRNHNPEYSSLDNVDSLKFNAANLRAADFKHADTAIHLSEFSPSDWWLEQHDIPRALSRPEIDRVTAIGIDLPHPIVYGSHDLKIHRIEVVGSWFSREQLYLGIILAWMALLSWEALSRMITLYQRNQAYSRKLEDLAEHAQELQQETDKYKILSTHDGLTGALNRSGLAPVVERIFNTGRGEESVAILLLDIDHFKRVNDRRGHDAGDRVLKEFSNIVQVNTRQQDHFARWGGEEFILVSTDTTLEAAQRLAEKIRLMVAQHIFEAQEPLQLSVSIGVTEARADESFESAFKRADQALYQAKDLGRNCVIVRR